MPRVRLSRQAQDDFDAVIDYLARNADPGAAPRYGERIRAAINQLAHLPHIGSRRYALGENVRAWVIRPYLIVYDPDSREGVVEVLRILHGARDIDEDMVRKGRG